MVVVLSFLNDEEEYISGIPRFVTIQSSEPAIIYYTIDGSIPNQLSQVYSDPIEMPIDGKAITLSAVGYYLDNLSNLVPTAILSNIYYTDQSDINKAKYVLYEGIVYMYPGGLDIPFLYDSAGAAAYFTDIPLEDLTFIESVRNSDGSQRELENEVSLFSYGRTSTYSKYQYNEFDTPTSDYFNPDSLFILIDGRQEHLDGYVKLFNGPHMDLRDPRRNFIGLDFYSHKTTNYRSTHATKSYYDRDKNIIVFYYFDTNMTKWVKSIQTLPDMDASKLLKPSMSSPVVFKWFNWGRVQN